MKIYFAGAIVGNSNTKEEFFAFMEYLKRYGEVVDEGAGWNGEDTGMEPRKVHERDFQWLNDADVLVAEVTEKSLGVGYEIGRAIELKKKILCLYRPEKGKRLSSMISGSKDVTVKEYTNREEAFGFIDDFLKQ